MITISREWLMKTIAELEEERDATPGTVNEDAANALAAMKLALASIEAEPVSVQDERYQHLSEIYHAQEKRLFKLAQRIKGESFDKYSHSPSQAIDVLESAIFGESAEEDSRAAMLQVAEPVTTAYKLPMQPLVIDAHGRLRFKENQIVRTLLDYATEHGYGLNEIAREEFDAEDQMQLAQLIGYSLSGYGTLSYVTDESYERAAAAAPQQEAE
ncbi:hypothetical protein KY275_16880 [Enterobacter hormaechei]|uniref:hypothetical protein n=1 Tax=Enterobacter cloacae complex TaxID=354276 RepID=UPI001BD492D6|nr:hypothetical protein [Enterobacter hormaechei]EHN8852274.1 hypothetical protein [Enterobacter hormaechei]EHN8879773.1 hypothetical protein [Enterobacter hormaechei]QXZ35005.1 hypothetical protein KY275_16880 [Enterobacter hormaechei]